MLRCGPHGPLSEQMLFDSSEHDVGMIVGPTLPRPKYYVGLCRYLIQYGSLAMLPKYQVTDR